MRAPEHAWKAPPKPIAPAWLPQDATRGVDDPRLGQLLADHWAWTLEHAPLWATELGVHEFDDRLADESERAILAAQRAEKEFLRRAVELRRAGGLSTRDRTTLSVFSLEREANVATDVCAFFRWSLNPRYNLMTRLIRLPEIHEATSERDARNLLSRYRAIPKVVDDRIANLRSGLSSGLVANARSTATLVESIEKQLGRDPAQWPLMRPTSEKHPEWSDDFRNEFAKELRAVVTSEVIPAFRRYATVLREEILPEARGADNEGLSGIPNGAACYAALIKEHTTLDTSAKKLHLTGLADLRRVNQEMETLGMELFGTSELQAILKRLREDPAVRFETSEEIVRKALEALNAAERAAPEYFSDLPAARCVVREIPDYETAAATLAYYRPPHADGSKPGEFFVNTAEPTTRFRFELEVLTFHESVPGHHLQIALAQELGGIPAFRKHAGATAFVEGWGLYAEGLASEMGLYSAPLDQMGRLGFEAWRAARLVVDTGLHAMGWSRERAIRFMMDRTALSRENVGNEVDRYLVTPGQALAYKSGQLEILRLRGFAEAELGSHFDIRGFHDAVLSRGAVPLPVLAEQVTGWVETQRPQPAAFYQGS